MATDAEVAPPVDLTGFQRDLLAAISRTGAVKGLAVKEHLEDHGGYPELNHGRLYPNLNELVEKGLVSKGHIDDRTNEYGITPRGKRVLSDYVEWLGGDDGE